MTWLLNYRGGSFMTKHQEAIEDECRIRGVSYEIIADIQSTALLQQIAAPSTNQDAVRLVKPPRIAVYSPKNKQPWDDAVTLVLTYAEIPYDVVYDPEVLDGVLPAYDWLHLHHEDFTGQYGKFWHAYRNVAWYQEDVAYNENLARELGYSKVSQLKLAVAKKSGNSLPAAAICLPCVQPPIVLMWPWLPTEWISAKVCSMVTPQTPMHSKN